MTIECPAIDLYKEATTSDIDNAISKVQEGVEHPFVVLMKDDMTYVQAGLTENGFVLEYQEGSLAEHYVATVYLEPEEVSSVFTLYLYGNEAWKKAYTYRNKNIAGQGD